MAHEWILLWIENKERHFGVASNEEIDLPMICLPNLGTDIFL